MRIFSSQDTLLADTKSFELAFSCRSEIDDIINNRLFSTSFVLILLFFSTNFKFIALFSFRRIPGEPLLLILLSTKGSGSITPSGLSLALLGDLSGQISSGIWRVLTTNLEVLPTLTLSQWQIIFDVIGE